MTNQGAWRDWARSDPYYNKPAVPHNILSSPAVNSPLPRHGAADVGRNEIFSMRSPTKPVQPMDSRRHRTDIAPYNDGSPLSAATATLNRPTQAADQAQQAPVRTKVSDITPYYDGSLASMPAAYHELAHRSVGEADAHLARGGALEMMHRQPMRSAHHRPGDHELFPRAPVCAHPPAGTGRDAASFYPTPAGASDITAPKRWQGTAAPHDPQAVRRRVTDVYRAGTNVQLTEQQDTTPYNPQYMPPPPVVGATAASDLQVRLQPYSLEEVHPAMGFRRNSTEAINPQRFAPPIADTTGAEGHRGTSVVYTDIHPQSHIHPQYWKRSQRPLLGGCLD